jgi:hypothetical protein
VLAPHTAILTESQILVRQIGGTVAPIAETKMTSGKAPIWVIVERLVLISESLTKGFLSRILEYDAV